MSELTQVEQLLKTYGGEVDDFFKLWPPDKHYFLSSDKQAFLAYGLSTHVAVCLFDPIGRPSSVAKLLTEFKSYCESKNYQIVFIQTTDNWQKEYERCEFKRLLIGADAVIDIKQFTTQTIKNKYFRNLVNRIDKQAYSVKYYEPPHTKALISELKSVSDDWLKLPNHKEWRFLTGRFDETYLQQTPIYILRDKANVVQAFTNQLPSFKTGVVTIDLMRHKRKAPPNAIDFLFIEILKQLHAKHLKYFNLGLSPLDGNRFANNGLEKVLMQGYGAFQSFIGFKGLHQFKAKYQPIWEARYIWYTGSPLRLPQAGRAVLQLLLGKEGEVVDK